MTLFAPTYVFMYEKNIVASLYGVLSVFKAPTNNKTIPKHRLTRVKHAKNVYDVYVRAFFHAVKSSYEILATTSSDHFRKNTFVKRNLRRS